MSNNIRQASKIIIEELRTLFAGIKEEEIGRLIKAIEKRRKNKIYLIGQGRSGLMARAFAMRLMHLGFEVFVAGDTITPSIEKTDLVIACSGSGETGITCYLVERAKGIKAQIAAIVAKRDSKLARMADILVLIPATPKFTETENKLSSQHSGSLFEQGLLLLLDIVVVLLRQRGAGTSDNMNLRHANLE